MNSEIYNIMNVCKYITEGKSTEEIDILLIEELSELIKSITKIQRWTFGDEFLRCEYKDIIDNIYEELADVIIMIFQFIYKNKLSQENLLNEISKALGRGKHTTRLVELLEVNQGLIADTPGFSSLEIKIPKNDIKKYYPEFELRCKYKSCNHVKEEGCKIIELVNKNKIPKWRYENYLKFLEEVGKEKY